ncbi:hypothetical protein FRB98_003518 [Tulasnella sp. 332]|nr:hypothetical protein FRB98_003518 [Tulasnella sp. 332]
MINNAVSTFFKSLHDESSWTSALPTPLTSLTTRQIDGVIYSLENASIRFQKHIRQCIIECLTYRNMSIPIARLPVDLFSDILTMSISVEDNQAQSSIRLQELACVAKPWRSVIIEGIPTICGATMLYREQRGNQRWRKKLDLALRKSKGSPLTVTYDFSANGGKESPDKGDKTAMKGFINVVAEHARRWKSFTYTGSYFEWISTALEQSTPSLERLTLNFGNALDRQTPTRLIRMLGGPRLKHVDLDNVILPLTSFHDLKSLRLRDISITPNQPLSCVEDFLSVLRYCPKLEILSLVQIEHLQDNAGESMESRRAFVSRLRAVHLPRLRNLDIDDCDLTLSLALSYTLHAKSVSHLFFRVPPSFYNILPIIDSSQLFAPALARATHYSSQVHVTMLRHVIRVHSHLGNRFDWGTSLDFDFQLYGDMVTGGNELEKRRLVMGCLDRAFHISQLRVPLSMDVGHAKRADVDVALQSTVAFPLTVLDDLPSITELRLANCTNVAGVLSALSEPINGREGLMWRCMRLKGLWLEVRDGAAEAVARMLERRFAWAGDWDCARPSPLASLTFVKYHPSETALARMARMIPGTNIRLMLQDPTTVSGLKITERPESKGVLSSPSSAHALLVLVVLMQAR